MSSDESNPIDVSKVQDFADIITKNVEKVIVGKRSVIELILIALLCEGHVLHVPVAGADVGAVEEFEANGFCVRCHDLHARLIAGSAIVRHQEAVTIHVKHGDHVFRTVAVNLAHQRGAAGRHAESHFKRLAL